MSNSLKADIEAAIAQSKQLTSDSFVDECRGLTSPEILNLYRNYYYQQPVNTEQGLVAAALNEILPTYTKLLKMQHLLYTGRITEAKKIVKG